MSYSLIRKLGTHWRWSLSGLLVLFIILTLVDYVVGVRSDELEFAKTRIEMSPSVRREFGEPVTVKLRKFWGYSHRSGYGNSETRLSLIVSGSNGERDLHVWLRQFEGQWNIVSSTIPL
jgi:hypothetical protein